VPQIPEPPVILWFRQDLRLNDNPALAAAVASGRAVLPLFILDDAMPGARPLGGAARWWLGRSLGALGQAIADHGGRLVLRRGAAQPTLDAMIAETGADVIFWNRCYEPHAIIRDRAIEAWLVERSIAAESRNAALLAEPWTMRAKSGQPYKVFTPFWRALSGETQPLRPDPAPAPLRFSGGGLASDALDDWKLAPHDPDWAAGFAKHWEPGEAGAGRRLAAFLARSLTGYATMRDRPDLAGTARLSPHLHWGEIGPRQVWHAVRAEAAARGAELDADAFLRELGWREFSHHLLYHWPEIATRPWRTAFDRFPWRRDPAGLRTWQRGLTGYPIVDAGMRELWQTGWMHNRARMIVASFLTKHLLLDWRAGEAWFWDTLVDADLAQNAVNWQWVAGSGPDAAPYFRVFNPVLQGEKFDPKGAYVRRWLPELARLPTEHLHRPWEASAAVLAAAGVRLGCDYPAPILDHGAARKRALAAFRNLKSGSN
jgi:deoxyribodipyrimidine photo-lyase